MKPAAIVALSRAQRRDAVVAAADIRLRAMPDTIRQIRPVISAVLLALLAATLGACSGGDFGRTRADMRSDDMHRWLGAEVTSSVGLKPSQFQLTDEERQLRDLPYPMIEPPPSPPAWKTVFGHYHA